MRLNINYPVRVLLTSAGKAILEADEHATVRSVGEQTECALWELMRIFGPHMHAGMSEMPFVGNVVEVVGHA